MKRIGMFALLSAAVMSTASAASLVQSVSLGAHESTSGSLTFDVALPKFDLSRGTLTGISLDLSVSSLSSITAPSSVLGTIAKGDVTSKFKWTVSGGDSASVTSTPDTFNVLIPMRLPPAPFTAYATSSQNLHAIGSASSASSLAYLSATGTGDPGFNAGTAPISINYVGSFTGSSQLLPGDKFNGSLQVTYSYDVAAVPEPAGIAILGLGIVGLVARRRR